MKYIQNIIVANFLIGIIFLCFFGFTAKETKPNPHIVVKEVTKRLLQSTLTDYTGNGYKIIEVIPSQAQTEGTDRDVHNYTGFIIIFSKAR